MIWMNCMSGSEIKGFFSDEDFTIDGLLEYGKQCSSRSSEVLEEEHNDNINYQLVCSAWQKERCALLELTIVCESLSLDTAIND